MSTGPRPWIRRWLSAPVAVCGLAAGAIAIGTGFSTGGPPVPARQALYFANGSVPAGSDTRAAAGGRRPPRPAPDSAAATIPRYPVTDPTGGVAAGPSGGANHGGPVAPAPARTSPATGAPTPAGGTGATSRPAGAPSGTSTGEPGADSEGSTSPDGSDGSTSTVVPDYPVVTGPGPTTTTTTTTTTIPPATTTIEPPAGGSGTDS